MVEFTLKKMKEDLIKLYESWLTDDDITEFQRLMFKRAIFFLNAGHEPKKVENWVVSIEKKWTYLK